MEQNRSNETRAGRQARRLKDKDDGKIFYTIFPVPSRPVKRDTHRIHTQEYTCAKRGKHDVSSTTQEQTDLWIRGLTLPPPFPPVLPRAPSVCQSVVGVQAYKKTWKQRQHYAKDMITGHTCRIKTKCRMLVHYRSFGYPYLIQTDRQTDRPATAWFCWKARSISRVLSMLNHAMMRQARRKKVSAKKRRVASLCELRISSVSGIA